MYNIGDIVQKRYLGMGKRMRRFFLVLDVLDIPNLYLATSLTDDGEAFNVWLEEKSETYKTKLIA